MLLFLSHRDSSFSNFSRYRIRLLAEQAAAEAQRVPDLFEGAHGEFLGHQADPAAGDAVILHIVVTVDGHRTGAGIDDTADDGNQRGLAGAVGTEQGENFTGLDVQADVFQRLVTAGVGL